MADERDARLVLRADDRATKTFEQVSRSIKGVTDTLKDQAKAAEQGEGSLADYQRVLREVEQLGKDLNTQKSAVLAFERSSAAAEKAAERVAKSATAYDAYKAKVEATGAVSEAQAARIEKLGGAVERNQAALDKQNARVDTAREKLVGLGLSSENTAAQIDSINAEFKQVVPLFAAASKQVDEFAGNQDRAAQAARALAAAEAETSAIVAREAAAATAAEKTRTASLLEASRETLAGNKVLEASFVELQNEIRRTAEVDSFRKLGADAVAASTNLARFAQTGEAASLGLTRLAEGVRQIVQPTLAEVTGLDGALKQIDASLEVAGSKQKLRVSQYQDALNGLTQAQAGLVRQAQNIDSFNKQVTVVDRLEVQLGKAAVRYEELGRAALAADAPSAELARDLELARKELERTGATTQEARKQLADMSEALKRAGIDSINLAEATTRIQAGATRSAEGAAKLTKAVGGNGAGFLGLKPYELQNFYFQLNDVVTSIASGISPMQTLAQQGGQVVQIFPAIISGAVRLLPVLLPVAAAIGAIAYNLIEAKKASDATKGFADTFALSGNAAGLSAAQFGRAQVELEHFKVSAADAQKVLHGFIDAGLDARGLDGFLTTVRAIAKATGEDIPAAASLYTAALSGGYDQVVALNDITHTLTEAQLDQVKALFDAGKAQEARTAVDEIYRAKADEIAAKSKTEWKSATESLSKAFDGLNSALGLSEGSSSIAARAYGQLVGIINKVAGAARDAKAALDFLQNGSASFQKSAVAAGLAPDKITSEASSFVAGINRRASAVGGGTSTSGGRKLLDDQQTQLKNAKLLTQQQRLLQAEQDAANKGAAAGANDAEIAQAKLNARKIEQGKIDKENATAANKAASAARSAESKAEAAARAAEARQNKINGLIKDLENTYDSLAINKNDDPFEAIQKKADIAIRNIRAKFADLAKLGVTTVDGKTQAQFETQVKASAALETEQAKQKKNEDDINKLLETRKTRLDAIAQSVKDGDLTPSAGIDQSQDVIDELNPKIQALAASALDFASSLEKAKPDPKLEAFIAKLNSVLSETAKGGAFINIGLSNLKEAQSNLDALVNRRNAIVQLQTALEKAGLKTPAEAQRAITEAFDASRPGILGAADAVQRVIDRLKAIPGLTPEVQAALDSAAAGLVQTRTETKHLDEDLVSLKNSATQALANGIGTFIESLGDTIASVLDGASSLKDALGGIANAALAFAAQFTRAIAQAIIQLVALKIAQTALKSVGLFHGGGIAGAGSGAVKSISPLAFLGATRYHGGGLVGLLPDEVPAILQKGEEVITATDPRHRTNGGRGGGSSPTPVTIKNVNLFDAGEAVSQGANTRQGEQAILNVVQRNKRALGLPG